MDRTDRATMIFCKMYWSGGHQNDIGQDIKNAISVAYKIEEDVLEEERRRARED